MKLKSVITPFKVGLLVIFGAIAGIFMLTMLGEGIGPSADDELKVFAIFDDATGLAVRSRIQMSGIAVGTIEKISLVGGKARVDFKVRKGLELKRGVATTVVGEAGNKSSSYKNGTAVTKKQASLIGDFYIEIAPGTAGEDIGDGDQIMNVIEPIGIDQIMERMDAIAADVGQVTKSLAAVFGGADGQRSMQKLVQDLGAILDQVNTFVATNTGKLDTILSNVETISADAKFLTRTGSESVTRILADSEAIVREVRYIIGQSSSDVQSGLGTLKGTLSRLQGTLDSLNYSLQNIQDITDKVNEGEGTLGELVNNPAIAQRTEQILEDAGKFVDQVSRLKTVVELRSEYHLKSQQNKNILGLRLQPSKDKYYLIELVDDFRGKSELIRTTTNTNEAGSDDQVFTETEVRTTDEFKVSVQFAKTFFPAPWLGVTGRFGLVESSGGLGGNLLFLEDQSLQIQADIFDFGEDVQPRLRTFATWNFFSVMYLHAGIDDSLNAPRREYFLGGGLRFDDEDLKAILTTTGLPGQ